MSHALLLRLFLSPSFFSISVALQYLTRYYDNIGITYYLTRRLKEFDANELREVWGFICHLLLTRPSKSRALECFVVEICEQSTHMAMFTLWFMQAYLKDLALAPNHSQAFSTCRRILHRCHEIIFEDVPGFVNGPYSNMKVHSQRYVSRKRVKYNVEPVVIGLACVLAGAPGLPKFTEVMGPVAIEQGREEDAEDLRSIQGTNEKDIVQSPIAQQESPDDDVNEQPTNDDETVLTNNDDEAPRDPKLQKHKAAQTTPAFSTVFDGIRRSEAAEDPFGQLDAPTPSRILSRSSPVIATKTATSGSGNLVDDILRDYDKPMQSRLLRVHYCRSEIQFVHSLESISSRLLIIPKPARVSALRAELISLNHKLPAEVCMPMWCLGFESPLDSKAIPKPHHRIVRIPPGECVVLNSAERAPFLLLIEILHDDLDFDSGKLNNRELIREMIRKDLRSKKYADDELNQRYVVDEAAGNLPSSVLDQTASDALYPVENKLSSDLLSQGITQPPTIQNTTIQEEEVDLVEQIYGENFSVHQTPDLSETLVVPVQPKNRALDIATWSRASSLPPSPALTPSVSVGISTPASIQKTNSFQSPSNVYETAHGTTESGTSRIPVSSLDEYSERMRTAAIMLAQLNASLHETATPSHTDTLANRTRTSADDSGATGTSGPLHPSLSGNLQDPSKYVTPGPSGSTRMKLQTTEVAAIRERIMQEMIALEEERMARMQASQDSGNIISFETGQGNLKTTEDEQIIRRELNRIDPSAIVFQESWAAKKSRVRQDSPYGHLASWDCVSVIVKTGADLRQEQLAVQIIREFDRVWREERCQCWVRPFQILITGGSSGLVETITDAVSIHSIKKSLYARRLNEGRLDQVTLLDHFINSYGDSSLPKFARAQQNFVRSLAGYSIIAYLLQIKDRHNGNILLDRDGHLIHIDFGFMLSNSPGNIGFEAAPFKLTSDYVQILGGVDSPAFGEFKRLFHEGFEAARKHSDRFITIIELMQKDSSLPCFAALGEQTAQQLRERFQPKANQQTATDYIEGLIMSSLFSNWTRLYDSYQYYAQSIL